MTSTGAESSRAEPVKAGWLFNSVARVADRTAVTSLTCGQSGRFTLTVNGNKNEK